MSSHKLIINRQHAQCFLTYCRIRRSIVWTSGNGLFDECMPDILGGAVSSPIYWIGCIGFVELFVRSTLCDLWPLSESEKATAFHLAAQEIELICFARDQQAAALSVVNEMQAIDSSECSSSSDDEQFTLGLGKPTKRRAETVVYSPQTQYRQRKDQMKSEIQMELEDYMRHTASSASKITDPIARWKERKDRFPKVAPAARKWLSVWSTSTPSERVFSICGVVDTARRNRLGGESISAQVLVHNNLSKIDVDKYTLATLLP
jgi:hAT family C-terminal dimerisation region